MDANAANALISCVLYFAVLTAGSWLLGRPLARAMEDGPGWAPLRPLAWLERALYRVSGIDPRREMDWMRYASALLVFNMLGMLVLYAMQRVQGLLPLNPQGFPGASPDLAFNTAVSFVSNTNWQAYGGESTFGFVVPLLGLTVQNFVSAAVGLAVLMALVRGFTRRTATTIGNFWVDLVRGTVYVLLPLSVVFALVLVSQGVVQTFSPYPEARLLQPAKDADGKPVTTQLLPLGPAASQVAIKQLGTNGGGYYNANSAHPYENPTPLSNVLEMLAILLLPGATCFAFGHWVRDMRQGWALYATMLVILVAFVALGVWAEAGNMEGKEVRFGTANSALWAAVTTAASNGSVNSMHDSFTPLGGLVPLALMGMSEVVFGGVGSGMYGMLLFVIVAVFIAGLMVGRTPEYLGKKIETYEMKMAALGILVTPIVVLVGTAVAVSTAAGRAGPANPGAHAFSEILYAFMSGGNNNGSAFAGLSANTTFYDAALGLAMLLGRYFIIVPVLAIAGSLARKKSVPPGVGTLPTHTPLFVGFLIGVVVLVGALNYVPALALGPVVEQLHYAAQGH